MRKVVRVSLTKGKESIITMLSMLPVIIGTRDEEEQTTGQTIYKIERKTKTYSTWDSLVVTDPTTSQAISGLSRGERTGSRVFHYLWPYVISRRFLFPYMVVSPEHFVIGMTNKRHVRPCPRRALIWKEKRGEGGQSDNWSLRILDRQGIDSQSSS